MSLKEALLKEYRYKTELHAHALPVSKCSEFLPKALAETYRAVGVDSLVLTNHLTPAHVDAESEEAFIKSYTDCYLEVKKYARELGFTVIFSVEIRFRQNSNDYLLYGVTEADIPFLYRAVKGGMGIDEFYRAFKRDGVVILQAHPFRNGMEHVDSASLDGIEVLNMHPGHNSRVAIAAKRAAKEGMLISGGTDFHHPGHEGCCLMRTKTRMETPQDVARVIKERDFILDLSGLIALP